MNKIDLKEKRKLNWVGENNPMKKEEVREKLRKKYIGIPTKNGKYIKIKKVCLFCNKEFIGANKNRFCSKKCGYLNRRGKDFRTNNGKLLSAKSMTGQNNPNWKGGTSRYYKLYLLERKWDKIRHKIYKRDNWTCQICGRSNIKIHAHHIVPYRISQDDSLENLITLCASCHIKEEWSYYNGKN